MQLVEIQMGLLYFGHSRPQLFGAALHGGGRIVEFVGHAGAELAQRGQLLALPQHDLLLQVHQFQIAQLFLFQAGV